MYGWMQFKLLAFLNSLLPLPSLDTAGGSLLWADVSFVPADAVLTAYFLTDNKDTI
jgi:hypothetical protein